MTTKPTEDRHQRPALEILGQLRRGRLASELTDALDELLLAVQDTGNQGKVTLTLTVKPDKVAEYDTPRVTIADTVAVSKPRRKALPSTFYLTDDAVLSRKDPRQDDLPGIHVVDSDDAPSTTPATAKAN